MLTDRAPAQGASHNFTQLLLAVIFASIGGSIRATLTVSLVSDLLPPHQVRSVHSSQVAHRLGVIYALFLPGPLRPWTLQHSCCITRFCLQVACSRKPPRCQSSALELCISCSKCAAGLRSSEAPLLVRLCMG